MKTIFKTSLFLLITTPLLAAVNIIELHDRVGPFDNDSLVKSKIELSQVKLLKEAKLECTKFDVINLSSDKEVSANFQEIKEVYDVSIKGVCWN